MSAVPISSRPSLVRLITVRLVFTTVLALALQVAVVAVRDYINETDFLNSYVRHEAQTIVRELRRPRAENAIERNPSHYFGANADAYAFRVVTTDGHIIAEHNSALLERLSPWIDHPSEKQDFWLRKLDPQARMHVVGGLKMRALDRELWVELATLGDPDSAFINTLALEIWDDVWMPMLPLIGLSLAVVIVSVRRSLRPLVGAVQQAAALSIVERGKHFDLTRLPKEAASFAAAINLLLDRAADLIGAQRLFIARAAHELRTPLSIMLLELEHIDSPRARRLEKFVHQMSTMVDRLLSLARLESAERPVLKPVRLAQIASEAIEQMRVWSEREGHQIELVETSDPLIAGDESLMRETIRNLLENAVKHTPVGTKIRVEIGGDGSVVVEDSGPGIDVGDSAELLQPFRKGASRADGAGLGLAIVRQATALQNGELKIGRSSLGGARFELRYTGVSAP